MYFCYINEGLRHQSRDTKFQGSYKYTSRAIQSNFKAFSLYHRISVRTLNMVRLLLSARVRNNNLTYILTIY